MNTTQLECFASLARTLNFRKTADALNLTQPAVSKLIQSLENELGTSLFQRNTRSVSLTMAGSEFLKEASTMLHSYYQSLQIIHKYKHISRPVLRIGYLDPQLLPQIGLLLRQVIQTKPDLMPELVQNQTDANLHLLLHNQLDLVLGMKDEHFSDEQVSFTRLHEDSFVCIFPEDHPLALLKGQDALSSSQLWPFRQIITLPAYLTAIYPSRGRSLVPVTDDLDNLSCRNVREAYALVHVTSAFALVPEHLALPEAGLVIVPWKESPHSAFGFYQLRDQPGKKNQALHAFVQAAKTLALTAFPYSPMQTR